MKDEGIGYQLVPPYNHKTNLAERAIQTFKNHFKTGLSLCHPDFPRNQWDRLIPGSILTLNLLRSSRVNPNLSAWAYICGELNFNATPLAPHGTKVVYYTKLNHRPSWDPNGEEGYYIGPSLEHYRCVKCYFTKTRMERDTDTVLFFPHKIPFPEIKL